MRVFFVILAILYLSGCTSMVPDSVPAAPDWFKDRRQELAGTGYPAISDVALLDTAAGNTPWDEITSELSQASSAMVTDSPGSPETTPAEMKAWAEARAAEVAVGEAPY